MIVPSPLAKAFLSACFEAIQEIETLIKDGLKGDLGNYTTIGYGGDVSLEADLRAEAILVKHLSAFGSIVSEESGHFTNDMSDATIVLDPIDGSDNLSSLFPYYGSSIFYESESDKIAVVVNFSNHDLFYRCNDEALFVGKIYALDFKEVVAPNIPKLGIFEKAYTNPELVQKLKRSRLKFRSPGAVALSLAYSHYVEFVLFAGEVRDFDILAGVHIAKDLHIYRSSNYLIVSKYKDKFDKLREIVK